MFNNKIVITINIPLEDWEKRKMLMRIKYEGGFLGVSRAIPVD